VDIPVRPDSTQIKIVRLLKLVLTLLCFLDQRLDLFVHEKFDVVWVGGLPSFEFAQLGFPTEQFS
jgi:hypothetical protein